MYRMTRFIRPLLLLLLFSASMAASAHHSFAVYDFETRITFVGVIKEFKFRNPHVAMKLEVTNEDGTTRVVNFIEGAPANMLVRIGMKPDMVKVGNRITAIGSPKKDDPDAFFLRKVVLESGEEFEI